MTIKVCTTESSPRTTSGFGVCTTVWGTFRLIPLFHICQEKRNVLMRTLSSFVRSGCSSAWLFGVWSCDSVSDGSSWKLETIETIMPQQSEPKLLCVSTLITQIGGRVLQIGFTSPSLLMTSADLDTAVSGNDLYLNFHPICSNWNTSN